MPVELRPLGVGEIFDRAVTLYVRNFAPFAIIAAIVTIPSAVFKFWLARAEMSSWQSMIDVFSGKHPNDPAIAPGAIGGYYASAAIQVVLMAFMYVAVAAIVGQLYEKRAANWREAFRMVLARFGTVFGSAIGQILALVIYIAAGSTGFFLLVFFSAMLLRLSAPLGIAAIVLTVLFGLAMFCGVLLCYLWTAFIFDAIGVERLRFVQAGAISWERIFNLRELWKALVIGFAIAAVQIGIMIVLVAAASLIVGVFKTALLLPVIESVVQAVSGSFLGVLVAVYYFDVRIRTEGLDMQADLDRLELQPQS